jgi:hypothetical protein
MTRLHTVVTTGLGIVVLMAGFGSSAWGQVTVPAPSTGVVPAPLPFGGELEGPLILKGTILCAECTLEEVRAAHPEPTDLYQLNHNRGQLVLRVETAEDAARWQAIAGVSHQIWVRAEDRVWQALTAEENLFKDVRLAGFLSIQDIGRR